MQIIESFITFPDPNGRFIFQNIAMLIAIYLSTNLLGIAFQLMLSRLIRDGFEDTKHCVESKIRLEHERQQQVRTRVKVRVNKGHVTCQIMLLIIKRLKHDGLL